jgi:hypothetical protein
MLKFASKVQTPTQILMHWLSPWPCLHHFNCYYMLKKKRFINEKVLRKNVYDNIQMSCQSIL